MLDLEDARNIVRKHIINGTAVGVLGAGIDPTIGKLIVFWSEEKEASDFLHDELKGSYKLIQLQRGLVPAQPAEISKSLLGRLTVFMKRVSVEIFKLPLPLSSKIHPHDGRRGRLGCFVETKKGSVAALTVNHLFRWRNPGDLETNPIYLCNEYNQCDSDPDSAIGRSVEFSTLDFGNGTSNAADCALFTLTSPSSIPNAPTVRRSVVEKGQLSQVEGRGVVSLAPKTGLGIVLDTNAVIKYEFFAGVDKRFFLFDHQIFLKNGGGNYPLGIHGDSGALIILDQTVGTLGRGSVLGLYSWTSAVNDYHFATPMFACMNELGIMGIYNP
jgi:hypothetical protein